MDRRHTDREYEGELETLREQVLLMGARVEEMMTLALRAFSEQNPRLAASTIAQDRLVDAAEMQIDELCLRVLALRQPVASDLRLITTTLKLVTDLERIADLCVNLCERVAEFDDEPAPRSLGSAASLRAWCTTRSTRSSKGTRSRPSR